LEENKIMDSKREFKGVWIPKKIWFDKRLNANEKILLFEIDSLDNEGHCFASNAYFAEFMQVSKITITRSIKHLKELGLISSLGFDGRKRILKSNVELKKNGILSK